MEAGSKEHKGICVCVIMFKYLIEKMQYIHRLIHSNSGSVELSVVIKTHSYQQHHLQSWLFSHKPVILSVAVVGHTHASTRSLTHTTAATATVPPLFFSVCLSFPIQFDLEPLIFFLFIHSTFLLWRQTAV